MKKCKKCNIERNDFTINRYTPDGLHTVCKECTREMTKERRQRLDVMLKKVDLQFHAKFKKLHKKWSETGFPAHSRPVVVNNQVMTYIESKSIARSRKRTKVLLIDKDMNVVMTYNSIFQATQETGDSRQYIKWSSDNNTNIQNRNRWLIKK